MYVTQNWPWLVIIEAECWVTRIHYTRFSTFADVWSFPQWKYLFWKPDISSPASSNASWTLLSFLPKTSHCPPTSDPYPDSMALPLSLPICSTQASLSCPSHLRKASQTSNIGDVLLYFAALFLYNPEPSHIGLLNLCPNPTTSHKKTQNVGSLQTCLFAVILLHRA